MRARGLVLCAMLMAQSAVAGQRPTTADGIDALVRGDYARAAEILQPIAERSLQRDHAAEFFMGTLYENGFGVAADITRACALYVRISGDVDGAFAETAEKLIERLHGSITRDVFSDCLLLANVGLDARFEPASFTLAPDYTVSWDLRGATITRDGRETRKDGLFAVHNNGVFLPIRHTELRAGPQRATARHFMEVSIWHPQTDGRWMLLWNLFEAVENDLVSVDRRIVAEADVDPRDADPVDIREFASISVNARGDVEWKVFSGPDAGSGTIVTADERAAAQQRDRARREAEERVDWERQLDASRRPSLTYIDGGGCAHIFVYGWSPDRAEDITIRANKPTLGLSTAAQTFDLAAPPAGLEVTVHVYDRAVRHWPYCTDVGMPESPAERTWRAVRGRITIQLSPPGDGTPASYQYRATIRIDGGEFSNAAGERVEQSRPIELTGVVGWLAG